MKTRIQIAAVLFAIALTLPACVRLTLPGGISYTRLGTAKAAKVQVKLGTNQITLQGYQSDGEALAAGIAEGVARGLKP